MSNRWFDTHAHLSDSQYDPDREEVIVRAKEKNVIRIIDIADGPPEWDHARELSSQHPDYIYWAAGLHPYFAEEASSKNLSTLESFKDLPRFVAIGEIGLDYAKCQVPHDIQIKTFESTIELALRINKPLVIHCRDAYSDLISVLKKYFPSPPKNNPSPGVIHCFSGNHDDANTLLQMGFYLGIDGPLTYPSAKNLRSIFHTLPLEKIVIETDAPYLPPQPFRGQRNEPSYIPLIGEKLAELREMSVKNIGDILMTNSLHLYRLDHI